MSIAIAERSITKPKGTDYKDWKDYVEQYETKKAGKESKKESETDPKAHTNIRTAINEINASLRTVGYPNAIKHAQALLSSGKASEDAEQIGADIRDWEEKLQKLDDVYNSKTVDAIRKSKEQHKDATQEEGDTPKAHAKYYFEEITKLLDGANRIFEEQLDIIETSPREPDTREDDPDRTINKAFEAATKMRKDAHTKASKNAKLLRQHYEWKDLFDFTILPSGVDLEDEGLTSILRPMAYYRGRTPLSEIASNRADDMVERLQCLQFSIEEYEKNLEVKIGEGKEPSNLDDEETKRLDITLKCLYLRLSRLLTETILEKTTRQVELERARHYPEFWKFKEVDDRLRVVPKDERRAGRSESESE